jgi:hypothetical protein
VNCKIVPFKPEIKRKIYGDSKRTISPSHNTEPERKEGKLKRDQMNSFNMLARSKVEITTARKKFAHKYLSNVFNTEGNEEQRRLRK